MDAPHATERLSALADALSAMGLRDLTRVPHDGALTALRGQTSLFPFTAGLEGGAIRLSCRLREGVARHRIALWHTVHLAAAPMPLGQWVLMPDGALALTALIPLDSPLAEHLAAVSYALLTAAEAHARQVHADFDELPFDETQLRANLLHLVRTDLHAPTCPVTTREAAALTLERLLQQHYGEALVPIRAGEWALAGPQLVQLSLEALPFTRRRSGEPDWALVLRCDATAVELGTAAPDAATFIRLNRLNHGSWGAAHGLRHAGRRATLTLTSELPAALVAEAPVVLAAIAQLSTAAEALGAPTPAKAASTSPSLAAAVRLAV